MANSKVNPKCTILDKNNELHGALDMHKSMKISPISVFRLHLQYLVINTGQYFLIDYGLQVKSIFANKLCPADISISSMSSFVSLCEPLVYRYLPVLIKDCAIGNASNTSSFWQLPVTLFDHNFDGNLTIILCVYWYVGDTIIWIKHA